MSAICHAELLKHLYQEYRSLNPPDVEYRNGTPSPLEFARIVRSNRPVVFKNCISDWPALQKWDDHEYLKNKMGAPSQVTVAETPNGQADSIVDGYFVEPHLRTVAFDEILDWLRQRQAGENGGSVRYVQSQNDNLNGEFINLREDVCELEWANEYFDDTPDACNIWIGNEESSTSYHLDHYENLYCQVVGSKTFELIPPVGCSFLDERLSPTARWKPSQSNPDILELEPTHSKNPWIWPPNCDRNYEIFASRVTLDPADVLYLPALWYHSVTQRSSATGLCIAVNYWYDMDFSAPLYPMFNFVKYLTMLRDGRSDEVQKILQDEKDANM